MHSLRSLACVLAGIVVLACVGSAGPATAADVPHWKVWLCSPAVGHDWCRVGLSITNVDAAGNGVVEVLAAAKAPPVDCFYVYPTGSLQKRGNATLKIEDPQKLSALGQAASFERVCRVFAPMYRQVTGYASAFHPDYELEYNDVLTAWRDYLAHHNHGRGVVLIGHSEGAYILKRIIREEIEDSASARKLLVSAILLGGGVTVATGSDTGGDFESVRACRKVTQTGCVIAYSTWGRTPPKDAAFQDAGPGKSILCVNPAAPAGGAAPITPVFPWFYPYGLLIDEPLRKPTTNFMAFPALYTARCVKQGRRAWLRVERVTSIDADPRPTVQEVGNPDWGFHAADVSIALGDLVELVRAQGKAWAERH